MMRRKAQIDEIASPPDASPQHISPPSSGFPTPLFTGFPTPLTANSSGPRPFSTPIPAASTPNVTPDASTAAATTGSDDTDASASTPMTAGVTGDSAGFKFAEAVPPSNDEPGMGSRAAPFCKMLASWSAALDRQDHMMQDPRREYAGSYGGSYSRQYYMTGIVAQPPYVGKSAEELRWEDYQAQVTSSAAAPQASWQMFDGVRQAATVSDDEQEEPFWRKAPAMHLKGHISEEIMAIVRIDNRQGIPEKVITASDNGSIREWNLQTGKCESTRLAGGRVFSMVYSASNGGLLILGMQGAIQAWPCGSSSDTGRTGNIGQTLLLGHQGRVDSLVVLPRNGQSSCNRSKTCVVGNGGEDGSIQEVELSEKPPDYFSVHNNGNSSCYTNSEDIITNHVRHKGQVTSLTAFESFICSADVLGHVMVWDVSNMTVIQDLRNSPYPVKHLCLYGNYLLVADANGTIKAWYTSGKQQFGLCFQPRPSFVLAREEGSLPSGIKTMKPITDRRVGNILMVVWEDAVARINGTLPEEHVVCFELPSFQQLVCLEADLPIFALSFIPGRSIIVGCGNGVTSVFLWPPQNSLGS